MLTWKKYILILLVFLGCSLSCPNIFGQDNSVLQIGNGRQLFVDHFLIDTLIGTELKIHHPHNEGVAFSFNEPWEGPFCNYITIIKDGNLIRAYYRGSQGGKDGNDSEVTCIAESLDGIHWVKPEIGIYEVGGTIKNNIVLAHEAPASHNFSPFLDNNPHADLKQRYKALSLGKGGLIAWYSQDGLRWKKLRQNAIITKGVFDSQNVAFWSSEENCYVCYFRTWTEGRYKGLRTVSKTTSKDFINWSDPVEMTYGDTPQENIYIQQTSPYYRAPQIYLAIGARFMQGREVVSAEAARKLHVNPNYYKDCSDVILMSTRGGDRYHRTFMEAFLRPGIGLDNWVSRSNYPALNIVQTSPTEISMYIDEDYAQPTNHLQRYSLRIDGFVSVQAGYEGGELITKPFIFSGNNLELNYSTSAAGDIRIGVEDVNGVPIPGYSKDDCDIIIGNEIDRTVSWKGNEDISRLAGRDIKLHFYIKDADLYSLKFND